MKKRVIALFTAAAVACTSTTAYAHGGDVFGGKYSNTGNPGKIGFTVRIDGNAKNNIFTFKDVYQYGKEWNGISSNVNLVIKDEGLSTNFNQINVYGINEKSFNLGRIIPYSRNGDILDVNDDWYSCCIEINLSDTVNNNYYYLKSESERKAAAKKVFLHEMGHLLKLAHPVQNSSYNMHEYDGYPKAIMNEGKSETANYRPEYISLTITEHDKSCLIAKWGK